MKVFGQWVDRMFYSGTVASEEAPLETWKRWMVHFDDGEKKVLREVDILPLKFLTKGTSVTVMLGGYKSDTGIILGLKRLVTFHPESSLS